MKTLKNILKPKTLITLIAMMTLCVLTTSIFASSPTAFKDVPASYWGYKNIQRAYTDGVVSGSSYNEATGERYYSPEAKLTVAEFVTILTRAFYADEVNSSTATGQWYAVAQDVANKHSLTNGLGSVDYNGAASRYQMAMIMTNIMKDLGADMPTAEKLAEYKANVNKSYSITISDWDSIPANYQDAVMVAFNKGLISGKDAYGTFAGNDGVTRAEAATIYCRLADAIGKISEQKPEQPVVTPKPETPVTPVTLVTPEKPVEQPTEKPATGNYGPVGTLSDSPVTLSLSTHKPVVDYWSKAPADVQAMTDKDAFNAAVQTMKDKDIAKHMVRESNSNVYYNYACFEYNASFSKGVDPKITAVSRGLPVGCSMSRSLSNADNVNVGIVDINDIAAQYNEVFAPILARLNDNMSDKQKAEILIKAVTDRFDYGTGSRFDWLSDSKIGDCDCFADAVEAIFGAAGIPVMDAASSDINHVWSMAYLDGQWYTVDATCAEVGRNNGVMSISEHEEIFGYTFVEGRNNDIVAKALVEAAYD